MNIEESLIELKNYINDKTNPYFDNYGFATVRAKQIQAIETLLTAYEKEKEKNKELSSQIDEHVYNGCDYELCNKKWLKKIKALMEKEDKLFFETKDVRHANRYKAYKELIEEE